MSQKENELRQAEADAKKVVAAADGEAKKSIALAEAWREQFSPRRCGTPSAR